MRAKMRFEDLRYCVKDVNSSSEIPRAGFGEDVPLNLRFSCFAFRATTFLSPALGFFRGLAVAAHFRLLSNCASRGKSDCRNDWVL